MMMMMMVNDDGDGNNNDVSDFQKQAGDPVDKLALDLYSCYDLLVLM